MVPTIISALCNGLFQVLSRFYTVHTCEWYTLYLIVSLSHRYLGMRLASLRRERTEFHAIVRTRENFYAPKHGNPARSPARDYNQFKPLRPIT